MCDIFHELQGASEWLFSVLARSIHERALTCIRQPAPKGYTCFIREMFVRASFPWQGAQLWSNKLKPRLGSSSSALIPRTETEWGPENSRRWAKVCFGNKTDTDPVWTGNG